MDVPLKVLSLRRTGMGSQSACQLAIVISAIPTLKELIVAENPIAVSQQPARDSLKGHSSDLHGSAGLLGLSSLCAAVCASSVESWDLSECLQAPGAAGFFAKEMAMHDKGSLRVLILDTCNLSGSVPRRGDFRDGKDTRNPQESIR